MTDPRGAFSPELRLCAAALAGDPDALEKLARSPGLGPLVAENRVGPGLAIRASEAGIERDQVLVWNDHMRAAAALRLRLGAAMRVLSEALATAEIAWTPLKGMGLDPELYPHPEERISTDIDALVSPDHLEPAIRALQSAGWQSLVTTDRQQNYELEEGYNWKFELSGILLELHFRLWGGVPGTFADDVLGRATPASEFGSTAGRVDPADAYIIAAIHVWQTPTPRYLMLWWDLHRMASTMSRQTEATIIDRATNYGVQAFVATSAEAAADLWGHQTNRHIAEELTDRFRPPERWAVKILDRSSPVANSLGALTLGRLLSNRPARSGWHAIPRQIWAHPGTVESSTPDTWSWPKRRLTHLARKLHLTKK